MWYEIKTPVNHSNIIFTQHIIVTAPDITTVLNNEIQRYESWIHLIMQCLIAETPETTEQCAILAIHLIITMTRLLTELKLLIGYYWTTHLVWKLASPAGRQCLVVWWYGRQFNPQAVLQVFICQSVSLVGLYRIHAWEGRLAYIGGGEHSEHIKCKSLDVSVLFWACHPKLSLRLCIC